MYIGISCVCAIYVCLVKPQSTALQLYECKQTTLLLFAGSSSLPLFRLQIYTFSQINIVSIFINCLVYDLSIDNKAYINKIVKQPIIRN